MLFQPISISGALTNNACTVTPGESGELLLSVVSDSEEEGEPDAKSFDIFPCDMQPRSIDRARIPDMGKHQFIDDGLRNLCEYRGADNIESRRLFVVVSGEPWLGAQRTVRICGNITNYYRTEKLPDFTMAHFTNADDACAATLKLPYDVVYDICENPVAGQFEQVVHHSPLLARL